jgi:peptidoglycan/LPS O-acetylase OafA/YrhL
MTLGMIHFSIISLFLFFPGSFGEVSEANFGEILLLEAAEAFKVNPNSKGLGISEECGGKLSEMGTKLFKSASTGALLLQSGKGVNEFGDYEVCIESESNRYVLLTIQNLPVAFALGICGPVQCKVSDYSILKPLLASTLENLVNNLEEGVHFTVGIEDVEFIDPAAKLKAFTKYGFGFWFTLLLIISLTIFVIISGIKNPPPPLQGENRLPAFNTEDERQLSVCDKILKAFSITRNYGYIFRSSGREDPNLTIFNGIRVLAMAWIMFGHLFFFYAIKSPLSNPKQLTKYLHEFWKAFIYNSTNAGDLFFFLSGFLIVYIVQRSAHRLNVKGILLIYLHRVIRLIPLLIMCILFFCFIVPPYGDGPMFYKYIQAVDDCATYWPYIIFFVNNYLKAQTNTCFPWTWYICLDMQFFLITPFLLILYFKSKKWGIIAIISLIIASFIVSTILSVVYGLSLSFLDYTADYQNLYYRRPYNRIPTYLMGMLGAHIFMTYKANEPGIITSLSDKICESRVLRIILYTVGLTGMFLIIHVMYFLNEYHTTTPTFIKTIYLVFSRPLFTLSLFILIYPAMIGRGSALKIILGSPLFSPMSKMTYGAYLIHECIILFYSYNSQKAFYLSYLQCLLYFWGYFTLGYVFSFLLGLLVEAPMIGVEREFLRNRGVKRKRSSMNEEEESPFNIQNEIYQVKEEEVLQERKFEKEDPMTPMTQRTGLILSEQNIGNVNVTEEDSLLEDSNSETQRKLDL